jgi:hypothetical protein
MAPCYALRSIDRTIRDALEGINVDKEEGQELAIQCPNLIIDRVNARHIANFMRQNPHTVKTLILVFDRFATTDAVEIFSSSFLTTTTAMTTRLHALRLEGFLGNDRARLLFSSLHRNTSITELVLHKIGIHDWMGGSHLTSLLQNNSTLTTLSCGQDAIGLKGARALQHGIRANHTLRILCLFNCFLRDSGLSVLVDALQDNSTVTALNLSKNRITSNGLVHVIRLLQQNARTSSSLKVLHLDSNAGLFHDEVNVGLFCDTLRNTKLEWLHINFCQLPLHAIMALFQVFVVDDNANTSASMPPTTTTTTTLQLLDLFVYDRVQLKGQDLEHLLNVIPQMRKIRSLSVNLNFKDAAVMSAFHRSPCIRYLFDENDEQAIVVANDDDDDESAAGPSVIRSLRRNRRLHTAKQLLHGESTSRQVMIPALISGGGGSVWAKAIHLLGNHDTGATAVYKILQEKLGTWCAAAAAVAATTTERTAATAAVAVATTATSATNTISYKDCSRSDKRKLNQDDVDDSENSKSEEEQEKFPKRARRH